MNVDTELNWVGPGLMLNVLLLWLKMGLMNHMVVVSFLVKVRVKQVLTLCFFRFHPRPISFPYKVIPY